MEDGARMRKKGGTPCRWKEKGRQARGSDGGRRNENGKKRRSGTKRSGRRQGEVNDYVASVR